MVYYEPFYIMLNNVLIYGKLGELVFFVDFFYLKLYCSIGGSLVITKVTPGKLLRHVCFRVKFVWFCGILGIALREYWNIFRP